MLRDFIFGLKKQHSKSSWTLFPTDIELHSSNFFFFLSSFGHDTAGEEARPEKVRLYMKTKAE